MILVKEQLMLIKQKTEELSLLKLEKVKNEQKINKLELEIDDLQASLEHNLETSFIMWCTVVREEPSILEQIGVTSAIKEIELIEKFFYDKVDSHTRIQMKTLKLKFKQENWYEKYKDSLIELEHPIELELNAKHNEINSIRLQNKNINTKINEIETGFKNYILSNENSEILKLIFEAFGVDIKTSENKNTKKLV